MTSTIDKFYSCLDKLGEGDSVSGAVCRQRAQDILANPKIALKIRTAIADLLMKANQELTFKTVGAEDSY